MRISFWLLIASFFLLQSCADVAMTGAQAFYNRRELQKKITDGYITLQANHLIQKDPIHYKDTNIDVATFNGEVLIAGQTPKTWQRQVIAKQISTIPQVKHVYNLVTVSNPTSTLQRMSDAWITAKVKSKLLASNDVDSTQIKVVTENGTVYLMGIIFPEDAAAAVDIASNTDGVERVVKVFSYLHVSKS